MFSTRTLCIHWSKRVPGPVDDTRARAPSVAHQEGNPHEEANDGQLMARIVQPQQITERVGKIGRKPESSGSLLALVYRSVGKLWWLSQQQAHAAAEPEPNPDDGQACCRNVSSFVL